MTPLTIRRITNLRAAGWGYKSIAAFCGLTRDQVRSCCRRYELTQSSPVCKRVCAWCGGREGVNTPFDSKILRAVGPAR